METIFKQWTMGVAFAVEAAAVTNAIEFFPGAGNSTSGEKRFT